MPHCILEYSSNIIEHIDLRATFRRLHEVLMTEGAFVLSDFKSRAIRHDVFLVGDGTEPRAFVALEIQVMSGKSDEQKSRLAAIALRLLEAAFDTSVAARPTALSVQVTPVDRGCYMRTPAASSSSMLLPGAPFVEPALLAAEKSGSSPASTIRSVQDTAHS